jgi:DNA invertase Pin-like site-specific DNA recombinase
MTANPRKPLIPYLRQSRAKERTISIEEQRRDIERWAKGAGVKLAAEVVEQGVSGSKPWRERALGAAITACEAGEAGGIVVAWQDRLSRENMLGTAEVWTALSEAGARIVAANEGGDIDRLLYVVKAEVARQQWERHQANWKSAKHSAWERGVYVGSPPRGYEVEDGILRVNGTSDAVREAYRLRAARSSWGDAARVLGVTVQGARVVISNPVYKGVHRCTCGCEGEGRREGWVLVAPSTWSKAQPRKAEPGQRLGRGPGTGRFLLSGVLRCAGCGHLMQTGSTRTRAGTPVRFYRCQNFRCGARAYAEAGRVEAYLLEEAVRRATPIHYDGTMTTPNFEPEPVDLPALESAVEVAEEELRAFTLAVPASTPGFADAVAARAQVLADAQDALEEARHGGLPFFWTRDGLRDAFRAMDVVTVRSALRELLPGGATVRRGRGLAIEEKVSVREVAA